MKTNNLISFQPKTVHKTAIKSPAVRIIVIITIRFRFCYLQKMLDINETQKERPS